jgi:hypothetical protein
VATKVRDRLDAGCRISHDAGPICHWLAVGAAERGDGFGLRHLVRQHVAERPELADFELPVAHRLDFGVVAGRNIDFDLAADLVADQLADLLVNRRQPCRGVVGFDAEPHRAAIRTVIGRCRLWRRRQGSER